MLLNCSIILPCHVVQIFSCYGVQMFIWRGKGILVQKCCFLTCLSEICYYNSYNVQQQIDMFEQCVLAKPFFLNVLWQKPQLNGVRQPIFPFSWVVTANVAGMKCLQRLKPGWYIPSSRDLKSLIIALHILMSKEPPRINWFHKIFPVNFISYGTLWMNW